MDSTFFFPELSLYDDELFYINHAILRCIKHADPDLGTLLRTPQRENKGYCISRTGKFINNSNQTSQIALVF